MLEFYEKKGRKFFIIVMISFVVFFSFAFIVGEFIAFSKKTKEMNVIVEDVQPVVKLVQTNNYKGQVEYIEGNVEKRKGEDGGWFSMTKSEIIESGDEVRTLPNSRAVITFEDGSLVRLDENTQIIFESQNENIIVAMDKGFIYNKVAKDDSRVFVVKTGNYEVKALGTEFSVKNRGEDIDVMVIESAVNITNTNNEIETMVEEGNKIKATEVNITKTEVTQRDMENDFIIWGTENKKSEGAPSSVKSVVNKKEKDEEEQNILITNGIVTLSGEKSSSGVRLHWEITGTDAKHGFKIVKSKEKNPVYPGNDYKYLSDGNLREYKWKIDTGKKYHFRVCIYDGNGKCLIYSNDVYVDTPAGDNNSNEYASSVSLSGEKNGNDVKLKWNIAGGDAPKGFKVVKSKEKNPVYPGNDYKYLSDDGVRKYTWKDLKKDKTYYFRVCVYKGGKCGTYSNNVKIEL